MRDDFLIAAILLLAVYTTAFSISFKSLDSSCNVGNGLEKDVQMCTGMDIHAEITKPYLFGLIDLPVYRLGYNIEYLHTIFFIIDGILIVLGIFTDKH